MFVLGLSCHIQALCWGKMALLLCGIWDLVPRPGIEHKSLALKGGFLTTGQPGKSPKSSLFIDLCLIVNQPT